MSRPVWILAVLLSHWRRHPMQLATLLIGLVSATALWSGVQALNQQARLSYARAATTFDKAYAPSRAWRGTAGWTVLPRNNYVAIDVTYSLNLNQPGVRDLNFAGAPKFTLAGEGNRPVYVTAASVVPTTGAVSPVESRAFQAYGRVTDRVSDLKGDARQITVYTIPPWSA